MRHLVSPLLASAVFLLPLWNRPESLEHPSPSLGLILFAILGLLNPRIHLREAAAATSPDRRTAALILVASVASQLLAVLDFAHDVLPWLPLSTAWILTGVVIAVAGIALRWWSIRSLGPFFTGTVRVVARQTVVQTGPYAILRHPSYSGALLVLIGISLILGSALGLAAVAGLVLPAYLHRIRVEEKALAEGLSEPYSQYKSKTWRLVPFVY